MHLPRARDGRPPHGDVRALDDLRERSCLLRCSLLLNARLQNWHLYFFSGADVDLRAADGGDESVGMTAITGIAYRGQQLRRRDGNRSQCLTLRRMGDGGEGV